ncbi:hypothetical protein GLOIN_2v1763442 [Rhizophagus irregularis DAOM 181602=DAOM 197198]|uniref:Ubiquitin-like domain-containing protein n=1 Tax=Rhizophagus irregularis (strain DAOM 181602 / DAOM 197198 / MUCL 43194) TaxID=747089 RepID=A0A2P4QU83_RHIID|nr:hypothetical protein GLOIN_2v1763442 [Rhizophagus irregularis DAOM 181602=DAOM 197198]POG81206.1 hypothetical protein GLOIN_2v1763442 [Rhizophagus irregularis DAOM 181602=DAOM 197198]CAG8475819.1 22854_t:CDS:2 [Rhizophagus irregularis]|eukprot:XP_025188072.1 hypothetical protein GLOIN_2v1763442 [Rhizophagus irregularis DAOM 181602=DAOM 197198]
MYLISVPNLPPVFSVHIEASSLYFLYKANVTVDTTIELLLKCFQAHVKDVFDYKFNCAGQDLQSTDTLKNLGLKNGKVIELHVPINSDRSIYTIKSMIKDCEDIPIPTLELILVSVKLYVRMQDGEVIELHVPGEFDIILMTDVRCHAKKICKSLPGMLATRSTAKTNNGRNSSTKEHDDSISELDINPPTSNLSIEYKECDDGVKKLDINYL